MTTTADLGCTSIWGNTYHSFTLKSAKNEAAMNPKRTTSFTYKGRYFKSENLPNCDSLPTSESSCGHPIPPSSNLQNLDNGQFLISRDQKYKIQTMSTFPRHVTGADTSRFWTGSLIYLAVLYYAVKVHRGECLLTPFENCTVCHLWIAQWTLHSAHCTVYRAHWTLNRYLKIYLQFLFPLAQFHCCRLHVKKDHLSIKFWKVLTK